MSGLALMTLAWVLLNSMSIVMATSQDAGAAMAHPMIHKTVDDVRPDATHQAHRGHQSHSDIETPGDLTMDECNTLACCVVAREAPLCAQSYQMFSPLSFDKIHRVISVEFKPGSQDRPPKHL
ncbi:MAG: hypothetical protein RQ750_12530 [Roseovarius sp.]|nr:hypothetical protein [Roseovarius sp.]